ncbi:acyltransferase family protein [Bradyrhizobium sp. STM 3562]|uniref:acyltransferase family protein n=1 Tax=Bradyrhizobium sp. STM 3562 TaxID=578924 RepID=UPI00388FCB6C
MPHRVNVPLSNLRAVVIVIVVAFHSVLPYLASQPPQPFAFDVPPYRWVAFPIIDHERWFGFDLFCAWQDVSLMSLMFFLAGLFAPASLDRKGSRVYLRERWWRIGLPFLLAAGVLSPLAYYASYRLTAAAPSLSAFWEHWRALPMWPAGPAWFLWQLFLLSTLAAALRALAPQSLTRLGRLAGSLKDRPLAFFMGLTALSILAYVPLVMAFNPWDWTSWGPFSFQLSRPLLYLLYFFVGYAIGAAGTQHGLLRGDGQLAKHWCAWLVAAVASFALWGVLTSLTLKGWDNSPLAYRLAAAFAYPLACASGVLCMLAICLKLMRTQHRVLDSLSRNAYGIYLLHYVFVVWLQYALLTIPFDALAKAAIVLCGALALSWGASSGLTAFNPRHFGTPGGRAMADQPR